MSDVEKQHIISAAQFELSKCSEHVVHQNTINRFNTIDHDFALSVAEIFPHITVPDAVKPNHGQKSEYLSMVNGKNQSELQFIITLSYSHPLTFTAFTASGRKVGIHLLPGYDYTLASALKASLTAAGVIAMIVSSATGPVQSANGGSLDAQFNFENCRSTHFDSIVFIGSGSSDPSEQEGYAKKLKNGRLIHAAREAYMHQKAIGTTGNAVGWLMDMCLPGEFGVMKDGEGIKQENGVLLAGNAGTGVEFAGMFVDAVAKHRVWDREVGHIAA